MEGGSVPVSFSPGSAGDFTLTAETISSFSPDTYITLEDKATNTLQKLNDKPVYNFTATSQEAPDRFVLHLANATAVPEPTTENPFIISSMNCVVTVVSSLSGLSGKVIVTDMLGRTIAIQNFISGVPTQINLKGKPGAYVLSFRTSNNTFSRKVVVF
jgi:hypothetical protein